MISFNFNYPCGYKAYAKKRRNYQQMTAPTPQLFIRRISCKYPCPQVQENIYSKINIFDQSQFQQQAYNQKRFRTLQARRNISQRIINQPSSQRPMSSISGVKSIGSSSSKIKPKTIYFRYKTKKVAIGSCQTQRVSQLNISKKQIDTRPATAQNNRYSFKTTQSQDLCQRVKKYKPPVPQISVKKNLRVQKKQSIISPW